MLIRLIAVLCLCLAANIAHAGNFRHFSDWTTEEQAWFTASNVVNYIDYKQTMWAQKQKYPNGQWVYEEINPMFPKRVRSHQIGSVKLVNLMLQYYLIGKYGFDDGYVKWGVIVNTAATTAVVAHNHELGIKVSIAF